MASFKFNRNFNVMNIVKRLVYTILALYVGGTILTTFGTVMKCSTSPFYTGLSLIGWTVTASTTPVTSGLCNATGEVASNTATYSNIITSTSGAGVLSVVGIIAIASVVMEFVSW